MKRLILTLLLLCGSLPLVAQQGNEAQGQLTAAAAASGCPSAGCLTITLAGFGGVGLQVQGTYSGTISFEGSVDGQTFVALSLTPIGSTTPASSTTSTGVWSGSSGGLQAVRARMSSYTSGTAVINLRSSLTAARNSNGGGGGVAGSDTQVQFNNTGAFGASASFTYNQGTGMLFAPSVGAANLLGQGNVPVVSNTSANSCGTSPATLAGRDVAGKVTVGATSGTSCTITFSTAWSNAPSCLASNEGTGTLAVKTVSTTTTVILSGTFTAGDKLAYICIGWA